MLAKKIPTIKPNEFDIKKLTLDTTIIEKAEGKDGKKSFQYTLFPKYGSSKNSGDEHSKVDSRPPHLRMITDNIINKKAGMQTFNAEFHKSESDIAFFWLCLDEEFSGSGSQSLRKVLEEIDEEFGGRIKEKPNGFAFFKSPNGDKTPLTKLKYSNLVRETPEPAKPIPDWKPITRCKVSFPIKGLTKDQKPIINVVLAVKDEEGGKYKQITVTSLDELRKYLTYGCEAEFVIDIKTFGILKSVKEGSRTALFKLTCEMMKITKRGMAGSVQEKNDWKDFLGDEVEDENGNDVEGDNTNKSKTTDKESKSTNKDAKSTSKAVVAAASAKSSKKDSDESDGDEASDKESNNSDKDDSDGDKSEEEVPKKSVEKSKKSDETPSKKNPKKSNSDDDEEEKPSKKSSSKKNNDSDEDEQPKKSNKKNHDSDEDEQPKKSNKKNHDSDEEEQTSKKPSKKGKK
jgi:hypothetical protein